MKFLQSVPAFLPTPGARHWNNLPLIISPTITNAEAAFHFLLLPKPNPCSQHKTAFQLHVIHKNCPSITEKTSRLTQSSRFTQHCHFTHTVGNGPPLTKTRLSYIFFSTHGLLTTDDKMDVLLTIINSILENCYCNCVLFTLLSGTFTRMRCLR